MPLWGAAVWLVVGLPVAAFAKPCLALIGVAANGNFYADRGGAWVRQSPKTVEEIVLGGCYPEGRPSPTSSVTLEVARHAPRARVQQMYDLLARSGWGKEMIGVRVWTNAPKRPAL
jgi:hypothetical protein